MMGARNAFEMVPDDGPLFVGDEAQQFSLAELLRALSVARDSGSGPVDFQTLCVRLLAHSKGKRVQFATGLNLSTLYALARGNQREPKHFYGEQLITLWRCTFIGEALPRLSDPRRAKA